MSTLVYITIYTDFFGKCISTEIASGPVDLLMLHLVAWTRSASPYFERKPEIPEFVTHFQGDDCILARAPQPSSATEGSNPTNHK